MAKETPEQKLLKIMSATQGSGVPAASRQSKNPKKPIAFNLKTLNQLLIVAVIIAIVVLSMEIRSGMSQMNNNAEITLGVSAQSISAEPFALQIQPISFYLSKISLRNIFRPWEEIKKTEDGQVAPSVASKLSKYKLVGVAWLDMPETATAMIEDTATGTTYFLREGEKLDDVTVKTIYTDRAVLGYENEEITIKL